VVIDAIRCAKLGLDRGIAGPLVEPSAYFMKSPPKQFRDDEARRNLEKWIAADGAAPAPKTRPAPTSKPRQKKQ
jgi:myo-inositol-1-phosphate synthase